MLKLVLRVIRHLLLSNDARRHMSTACQWDFCQLQVFIHPRETEILSRTVPKERDSGTDKWKSRSAKIIQNYFQIGNRIIWNESRPRRLEDGWNSFSQNHQKKTAELLKGFQKPHENALGGQKRKHHLEIKLSFKPSLKLACFLKPPSPTPLWQRGT